MMDYQEEYGRLHAKGKYFPGYSITPYVDVIAALVKQHKPERLLDYGCGRGLQYLKRRVHERWGGLLPYGYDIGVSGLDAKPEGTFGGVICTDVLEHIEERDVPGFLDELLSYAEPGGFVFVTISCRPANKSFKDGRNLHLTIKPPSWWKKRLRDADPFSKVQINGGQTVPQPLLHIVAHFDVAGHFNEPETPWNSWVV